MRRRKQFRVEDAKRGKSKRTSKSEGPHESDAVPEMKALKWAAVIKVSAELKGSCCAQLLVFFLQISSFLPVVFFDKDW